MRVRFNASFVGAAAAVSALLIALAAIVWGRCLPPQPADFPSFTSPQATSPGFFAWLQHLLAKRLLEGPTVKEPAPNEFPASFWANERCSATLVGPRVLLTAGHCFRSNNTYVRVTSNGQAYEGSCTTAKAWSNGRITNDIALCLMEKPVPVPAFECMCLDITGINPGDEVLLTGFGGSTMFCLDRGTHLVGKSKVDHIAGSTLVTKGGAWLRKGDSGGGGYILRPNETRLLISVNSTFENAAETSTVSLLSGVGDFIDAWTADAEKADPEKKKLEICRTDSIAGSRFQALRGSVQKAMR